VCGPVDSQLIFYPSEIKEWNGRYARIPGEESVFHMKSVEGQACPVIIWRQQDYKITCKACDCRGVRELTEAVLSAKRMFGGWGGGSFQINEFKQVIVPASDGSGRRALVGRIQGKLLFENPINDSFIDISDDGDLCCGDPWDLPYVGNRFNLSKRNKIYFAHRELDAVVPEYPPAQDHTLIRALRKIRRWGPMRFIVNPYGVVLTKRPPSGEWQPEEIWEPVYVGRINPELWFEKEE